MKGKEKKSSRFQEPQKRASGSNSFSSPGASSCLHWPPVPPRRHRVPRSLTWEDGSPHPPLESSPSCSETAWDRQWREKRGAPCAEIPSEGFWNIRGTDCCCSEETWQWGFGPGSRDTATLDSAKEPPNSGDKNRSGGHSPAEARAPGGVCGRPLSSLPGLWAPPSAFTSLLHRGPSLPGTALLPLLEALRLGSRPEAQLRAGRAPARPRADPSLRPQVPSPRH